MAKSCNRKRVTFDCWGMNEVGFLKVNIVCLHVYDKSASSCSWSKIVVCLTRSEWAVSGRWKVNKDVVWFISLKKVSSDLNSFERCWKKRIQTQNVCSLLHSQTPFHLIFIFLRLQSHSYPCKGGGRGRDGRVYVSFQQWLLIQSTNIFTYSSSFFRIKKKCKTFFPHSA